MISKKIEFILCNFYKLIFFSFDFRFSTSQWYDENGKVVRRYPTNEEIDQSFLTYFTKVLIYIILPCTYTPHLIFCFACISMTNA